MKSITQITMNPVAQSQLSGQTKELANLALFCKIGQEAVQEIVNRTTEMMNLIKTIQLPNGTTQSNNAHEERKNKLKNDYLKSISVHFKRLYKVYEKCSEPNVLIEDIEPENLIPIEGKEMDLKIKPISNDSYDDLYKDLQKDYNEKLKILKSKNAKIKEIIDRLRDIVWEVNTMLAMRGLNK